MIASSGIAIALGIWGCRYRELQPVFFGGRRILSGGGGAGAASGADVEAAEEYEMAKMEPAE